MNAIISKRLAMTLANLNDLPELEIIEKECDEYFSFDPPCEENHSCPIIECITTGDIPPGGKKENYFLYCIRQNNILIGFTAFYLEYQRKDIAYLSVIYIKEEYRKNGMGSEILIALYDKLSSVSIKEIRTHVSLRNAKWEHENFITAVPTIFVDDRIFPFEFEDLECILKEPK